MPVREETFEEEREGGRGIYAEETTWTQTQRPERMSGV